MKNLICKYLLVVHKNVFFYLNYISKKQPKTYFLSNLCKIPDIFANEIFHISNMKNFVGFKMKKVLPFCFSYDRKKPLQKNVTKQLNNSDKFVYGLF